MILTYIHFAPFPSYRAVLVEIFAFEWGYLTLTHAFSAISENININHILEKN